MKIAAGWSTQPSEARAATECIDSIIRELDGTPSLLLVYGSPVYDSATLVRELRVRAPDSQLIGGTSCLGVLTAEGFHSQEGRGVGVLAVLDPEGSYGVGISPLAGDPAAATVKAIDCALSQAGRPGEVPAMILTSSQPGFEEVQIGAIEEHLGAAIPIFGGTTADNDMSGQWQQFSNDTVLGQAVAIATLFPSGDIGYAFHSGYEPTKHHGRVTRADGRTLLEIDGRPAAHVYDEWADGLITDVLVDGGSTVPAATFSPLGDPVGTVSGVRCYRLSYPVAARADGALELFTSIETGAEVVLMTGTCDSLATRAGRVASAALDVAPFAPDECKGALIYFCTGCMLAVQDRMDDAVTGLVDALHGAPFLTTFTLGEQGCFIGGENRHGNLMIAAIVFGPSVDVEE